MIKAQIYPSGEQWYWRIKSVNGKVIADGAEGYASKNNCKRAFERLIKGILAAIPNSVFQELHSIEFTQSLWPHDLIIEVLNTNGQIVQEY